ncbi:MAG: universal stress protein [Nitrospirae bacterium]|nr:universal stress protein [Nitrospirota bacterium]
MKKIILCFDNSDMSLAGSKAALNLAKTFGAEVVGIHGYNAIMHEGAFRIMEPTLPQKYQKEEILQKQREVHKDLINIGMEKISLSYLKPLEKAFRVMDVGFRTVVREGKNFRVVNDIIAEEGGDIVIIGSYGFNSNSEGFLGSVCQRIIRDNDRNFLVVKKPVNLGNPRMVVCLDGSSSSIGALRMARLFAERYNAELHMVYVFDSALHKEVFERLKESVINKEGFNFNSKEQEKIHDEFIDKGLARVGSMIIEKAEKTVFNSDNSFITDRKVLEGFIYRKVCDYAKEINADLIFTGRTGRHFADGANIGSVTENVLRFSPCSVVVARHEEFKGWEL